MRRLLGLILILVLLLAGCAPGEWYDPVYIQDLTLEGPLALTGDGMVYFELRPDLDFEVVRANGKPTRVSRGIIHGWSLPIYGNDNEELFFEMHTPHRWNGTSDILLHIHCYLPVANDSKNFNLQISWMNFTEDDIIPSDSANITAETATGNATQYQSFHLAYTIDYDINPADPIASSDELHFRLRRLDASAAEITGEVVVTHVGLIFVRNKLGSSVP